MSEHFIRYETDGAVAVITLDRPQAANAQTPGILKDLDDAWRRADADPDVRVIVFTTTGKQVRRWIWGSRFKHLITSLAK